MSVTVISNDKEPLPGLLPDGRPDPEYARALGLLPAPLGRRAAAFTIDALLLVVLALPLAIVGPGVAAALTNGQIEVLPLVVAIVSLVLVNAFTIVQLALHGRRGFTIGKRLLRVRTVNVKTLERPGFWWIVLRALIVQVAYSVIPLLGAIPFLASPLFDADKRNRAWHDKLTGTWLVDIVDGLNPYDAKAIRHARRAYDKPAGGPSTGLPSLATGAVREAPFVPGARLGSAVVGGPGAGAIDAPPLVPASLPAAAVAPPVAAPPAAPLAPPTPPVAPAAAPVGSAVLTFDDGSRYQVTGTGLIGRNPAPRAGESFDGMLTIADSTASISKTHAAYGIDSSGFWVSDRASTNGTRIRESTGALLEASGERTLVPWGATVLLGDRYFVVSRA